MSDLGRKNVSDKVSEAVTPDNQKSTLEKTKETVTDRVDEFAGKNVPEDQKSFGQTISDKVQSGHEDAKEAVNKDQATLADTVGEYVESAKEQAANAAEYISGVVSGGAEGAKKASDDITKK